MHIVLFHKTKKFHVVHIGHGHMLTGQMLTGQNLLTGQMLTPLSVNRTNAHKI